MYKRHDPSAVEEIEFMENLFNSLCSALMLPVNRDRFLKGEGIQLMNLMLRLTFVFSAKYCYRVGQSLQDRVKQFLQKKLGKFLKLKIQLQF